MEIKDGQKIRIKIEIEGQVMGETNLQDLNAAAARMELPPTVDGCGFVVVCQKKNFSAKAVE